MNSQKIKIIKDVYATIHAPIKPSRPPELQKMMPENLQIALAIMIHGELVTVKELQERTYLFADMRFSQVSAILRKLHESNDVERIEADTVYYTVL